jgi:iron(II)-dependent oxidoreductase
VTRRNVFSGRELREWLLDARSRTLALVQDLSDEQMIGPTLAIVNPPLWEIGHVAWFQERWVLRHLRGEAPLLEGGDRLYDSAKVPHDSRWDLELPSRQETLRYMQLVLDRVLERLPAGEASADETYFHLLAVFHEDMHDEAIAYTRQTLGYAPPPLDRAAPPAGGGPLAGDVEIPGGTFFLGATPELGFVFDNEKWAHPVEIAPFRIARAPVTQGEFAAFVEDGGYRREELWSEEGWRWLKSGGSPDLAESFARLWGKSAAENREAFGGAVEGPLYWRREASGRYLVRRFDRWVPLDEHLPVIHVNWYEAEAYCRWAGRRLPTEAEWEAAAAGEPAPGGMRLAESKRLFPWGDEPPTPERANLDARAPGCLPVGALPRGDSAFGCRQMIGNVWEWTASDFLPYPGFVIDPYKEYSEPWFGTHKVLRGGCWATRSRLIRNTWRNFYTPDRRDVWAGFRTCAKRA